MPNVIATTLRGGHDSESRTTNPYRRTLRSVAARVRTRCHEHTCRSSARAPQRRPPTYTRTGHASRAQSATEKTKFWHSPSPGASPDECRHARLGTRAGESRGPPGRPWRLAVLRHLDVCLCMHIGGRSKKQRVQVDGGGYIRGKDHATPTTSGPSMKLRARVSEVRPNHLGTF